ncbi:MAG: glycosyltransferase family 4 protein [Parcubacteria group bacterium]|nr:glycosyltransferase family 4 protein [Parcubacteria group bacterium]MBI4268471.1 glycosyltransferase family 4 protein [Candidatus Uhrbacteria bacterium]
MTTILYIVTQQEFGGAQRYIFDLATNLDKSQYDVHIAAGEEKEGFPASNGDKFFDRARGQNLTVHSLKHLVRPISLINDFLAYFELKKLISELKPDIVHLNSSKAGVLGSMAAKALGVPKIIYTAHGFVFNEPMNPLKRWLYTHAELGTAKRVDRIIAVSEFDRQAGIKAGIDENKIVTVHNGIDPSSLRFFSEEDARAQLNITEHTPLIGCIANFYQTKGLDVLIGAMADINAQLVIVGDGELRPQLEEQIKKLNLADQVHLTGQLPDAHQYLKAFDIFVLASRKEGFPYVLLEAAAAGVPIVATRVGGVPEIIHDEITGYLAEPCNPDELAQKISQALAHPLAPQLPKDCTVQHMVEKTLAAYRA